MKKKILTFIIILFILIFPVKFSLKDGGTVIYQSLTYSIHKVHSISEGMNGKDYWEGTIIEVFGIEIYNNVE